MKKTILVCLAVILIFVFAACNSTESNNNDMQLNGETVDATIETTKGPIVEGEDWIDDIDTVPPADDTTQDEAPTEPEDTEGNNVDPTDPPTTARPTTPPTTPPTTDNGNKPTDPPVENTTENVSEDVTEQTTQDGIDLPVIPG